MKTPKTIRMKLQLSCLPKHGWKVEWSEPKEKAIETFERFQERLQAMLKEHGLLKDA